MKDEICKIATAVVCLVLFSVAVVAQQQILPTTAIDPGPRGAPVSAGGPLPGLSANQMVFFSDSQDDFNEVQNLASGLGPTFNSVSCGHCHSQPAIGGSSPNVNAFPNVGPNPQVADANFDSAVNKIPFFVTADGPVREARFKFVYGTPGRPRDGGVHDLYTIQGMPGAPGCTLAQPDFVTANAQRNLIFRIPIPVFGLGLIENIPDDVILANIAATSTKKQGLGIFGHVNRVVGVSGEANHSGNDGTVTRFGWKAQNKSGAIFAGEAYNVEQGITNPEFPNERGSAPAACLVNGTPEDTVHFDSSGDAILPDIIRFATFMTLLGPPKPVCTGTGCSASVQNGAALFSSVGCAYCHTPTLTTGPSSITAALSNQPVNLYSDLALHGMGLGLEDDIVQGGAGPDEFRTAPLWGIGQRVFFLHDGRTSDLYQAIEFHKGPGSEANGVLKKFDALTDSAKQDILNFLRSL